MTWVKGEISGVIIKALKKYLDMRGYLVETYRDDELPADLRPKMSYVSFTEPGICRGPHEHKEQTDIFTFIGPGNFYLKLWDNRKQSKTYGNYIEMYVGKDNPSIIIIPPGVIHGYKNISKIEHGMVINYPDQLYMGWNKSEPVDEIRHEDERTSEFKLGD
jgi:dTDP-4-dehydrorhamnose 3,5-epimerase